MSMQVYLVTASGSTTGQSIFAYDPDVPIGNTGSSLSLSGNLIQFDNDDSDNVNLMVTLYANQDQAVFTGMIPYSAFAPGKSPSMRVNLATADKWCTVLFQLLEAAA
jgi:hypothetical protein